MIQTSPTKMATTTNAASPAVDYKYVYVNYVVASPNGTHASEPVVVTNGDDVAAAFAQFTDILPLQMDPVPNDDTLAMNHQPFDEAMDEAAVAVQYITQNDQISVMVMDDQPSALDAARRHQAAAGDQLQRLTDEIIGVAVQEDGINNEIDNESTNDVQPLNDLDTSRESLKEYKSEDDSAEEEDDDDSEQELTNLAWLSDPNRNITVNFLAAAADDFTMGGNDVVEKTASKGPKSKTPLPEPEPIDPKEQMVRDKNLTQERFNKFMVQVQECQQAYAAKEPTYRDNAAEKPPFIYAQMIAMAMVERGRMTLKDIEQWIQERFAYYRCTGNWNNSIRHNLSIHFGFTKIARDKNEKGKGGYWELSMNITKGEKKRVRNRSKRGLVSNGVGGVMKRPRRMAAGSKFGKAAMSRVPSKTETMAGRAAKVVKDKEVNLNSVVSTFSGGVTLMSDGYETNCSDGTTSNGYEQEVFVSTSNLLHDGANEIFLGCDIPLSGDCIVIPYTGHTSTSHQAPSSNVVTHHSVHPSSASPHSSVTGPDSTPASPSFTINCPADYNNTYLASQLTAHATLIAHGLTNPTFGPNVIVETLPYAAHHQAVLDQVVDIERQFSSMVQIPEPELMAEYDAYFDYSGCTW